MYEYVKIPNIYKRETFGKNRLIEGDFSSPLVEYLSKNDWYFTEKVDGTNIRIIWDGFRVSFMGRTDRAEIPSHLYARLEELFVGRTKEELFEQKFGDKQVILYGEGFGEKIQKGGGLYGKVDFILFDVVVAGHWLNRENVEDVARTFQIRIVPIVGSGTLLDAVNFIKTHPTSMLRDAEMEGVVCKTKHVQYFDADKNPIMVKVKCVDFPKETV